MPNRTNQRWLRVYVDGYDLSGYARKVDNPRWDFGGERDAALSDPCKGSLPGQPEIGIDAINALLDNDLAGAYALLKGGEGVRTVLLALGMGAEPIEGVPAYMGKFVQGGYHFEGTGPFVTTNIPFLGPSPESGLLYNKPWGVILAPKAARTAVNSAVGIDDNGAATTYGGYLVYHLVTSNGTVTLKVQDAATNVDGSFVDITGATSGSITAAVTPQHGLVQLAINATVRRYLRWQIVLGTATTATFVLAFVRALLHNS